MDPLDLHRSGSDIWIHKARLLTLAFCRQVNQHIEFEADWENGFNLHIKLAPVIALGENLPPLNFFFEKN
jgi:hypothetical protein